MLFSKFNYHFWGKFHFNPLKAWPFLGLVTPRAKSNYTMWLYMWTYDYMCEFCKYLVYSPRQYIIYPSLCSLMIVLHIAMIFYLFIADVSNKSTLFKTHTVFNKTQMTQKTLDFYGEGRGKGTVAKVLFVAIFHRSKFNLNFYPIKIPIGLILLEGGTLF